MQSKSILQAFAAASLALLVAACGGGGGGGGGPANPADKPTATTTTDLDGYWVCVSNELIDTNTAFPEPTEPGEVFLILNGELVGNVTYGESYLRADLETELGFPLGWYTNTSGSSYLDFHAGYDRLRQGAGKYFDYTNYGLRFAATGPDTLIAIEAIIEQEVDGAPRVEWTYGLEFERTTEPRAAAKAYEQRMGEPFVPKGGKWFAPRIDQAKRERAVDPDSSPR